MRGSSSGIPASTLPTKSAPTSADFVKMPPPTLENKATVDAPIPKPCITEAVSLSPPYRKYNTPRPKSPIAATVSPIIEPPKKAITKLSDNPVLFAAFVVLTLAFVAVYIPINPVADEQTAPMMNDIVLATPSP